MRRRVIAYLVILMFAIAVFAPGSMAAVKPALKRPADYQTVAKTKKEHTAAAAHSKAMVTYLKGMAEHHKSMAAEHKKLGHTELAKHHMAISKNMAASAKEYQAMEKVHKKHAKTAK